jgi:hypothetical protein
VPAPGQGVQPHAGAAVPFDAALDPEEQLGVDGLRAAVATPHTTGHRGEEEQRQRADDQQHRQVDEVLRLQHQTQHIEAALAQIEQQGLATVPVQPGHAVEEQLGQPDHDPAPRGIASGDGARVDLDRLFRQGMDAGGGWEGVLEVTKVRPVLKMHFI